MYQVLYRKWRPKKFEDVVGQENITKTLKNEIVLGHIAHAYLFTGSRGTGKTTCARIFSLAVNCRSPINGNPCGKCDICEEASLDALLDISEIDAASNNGVENVRSIKEEIFLIPNLCKYRVYIIDESHMLSSSASNALLKMLEEPPSHAIFILATTEAHKIPATIVSRCQKFEFHRIPPEAMSGRIRFICEQENIEITDSSIDIIVDLADGSLRDALSLLDRCVSCIGSNLNNKNIEDVLGITDKKLINELFNYIVNRDSVSSFILLDKLYEQSRSMMGVCENLLTHFRKEMMRVIAHKDNIHYDRLDYILKCMDILQNSYKNMSGWCDKKIEMEIAVARMCFIDIITQEDGILKKPTVAADLLVKGKVSLNEKSSNIENLKDDKLSSKNTNHIQTEDLDKQMNVFDEWPKLLKYLEENAKSKTLVIALKKTKAYKRDSTIFIDSDNSLVFKFLKEPSNKIDIDKAFKSVIGKVYKIDAYKGTEIHEKIIKKVDEVDPLDEFSDNIFNEDVNIKFE